MLLDKKTHNTERRGGVLLEKCFSLNEVMEGKRLAGILNAAVT
jgi:hypothetical protein